MKIIAKTESGSTYEFTQKNGRTFFRKGLISGEVVRINNGAICVGKSINMDFRKDGLYGTPDKDTMFLNTPPVTEIQVIL